VTDDNTAASALLEGIRSDSPVSGLTHGFYKYPARFSPAFARAVISHFTAPGDFVFDPFMGGGTTLVEASALGRRAAGTDISSLAAFLARTKTTIATESELSLLREWVETFLNGSDLRTILPESTEDSQEAREEPAYQRNIRTRSTWAITKLLRMALAQVATLPSSRQQRLARCMLLKTAQWALDCRKQIPSAFDFRNQFAEDAVAIMSGAREYAHAVREALERPGIIERSKPLCLRRSAIGIEKDSRVLQFPAPKLVLTSPPYPGVHVLYHRWQIHGRRETPAPFWIANSKDGSGAAYYSFGDRKRPALSTYFETALGAFRSIARISNPQTLVVQMIAFSDPSWQLPRYLAVMNEAGFIEIPISDLAQVDETRVWRTVPNRKWYADHKGSLPSSKELVLFHRLNNG
jgi:hypothetical protein